MIKINKPIFAKDSIFYIFSIFILLVLSLSPFYPFAFGYVLYDSYKAYVSIIAFFLLIIVVVFSKRFKVILPNINFTIICAIQVVFYFIYVIIYGYSQVFMMYIIYTIYSWVCILLIENSIGIRNFSKIYLVVNVIMLVLTVLGVFLVVSHILNVINSVPYSDGKNLHNYGLFFTKGGDINPAKVRPSGYYDEPGSFSFIVMLLLLINRKLFQYKWGERLLLLLPLITTSLAHIITSVIYLLFYKLNRKNSNFFIIGFIMAVSTYFALQNYNGESSYLNFIKGQFVYRVNNVIFNAESDAGRGAGFALGPEIFKEHIWGLKPEKIKEMYPQYVLETYWTPLIQFGIIGVFAVYLLPFIYIFISSIKYRRWNLLPFLAIVFLNLLQRPFYVYPIIIIFLYIIFFRFNINESKKDYSINK